MQPQQQQQRQSGRTQQAQGLPPDDRRLCRGCGGRGTWLHLARPTATCVECQARQHAQTLGPLPASSPAYCPRHRCQRCTGTGVVSATAVEYRS